jgi:peptidoglycan hydrolase-like protein with peptidoglycan-binding domain/3D (Asp-Asp-Asp) domain-containing protein
MKNKYFKNILSFEQRWRLLFWATLGLLAIFSVTPRGYAQSTEQAYPYKQTFIISSYYSPLPGQAHYFKGSYERDITLNGGGVHGADGTAVYPGMAAAGKNIPFGTKMDIPGFGIVTVHDRGGAIKSNRIDLWMGAGEEGLERALGWGMRTLEVTVYGPNSGMQDSVNWTSIPVANLQQFLVPTEHFRSDLALQDEGDDVIELQRFLRKFGYFEREPTGYFGEETRAAVQKFQLENKVIDSDKDPGAGNFGPRSRVALEALLKERKTKALGSIPTSTLKKGDRTAAVKALQDILAQYGFLRMEAVNGIFDDKTFDALYRFQVDIGAVEKPTDLGAGFYGPKTQTGLKKLVSDSYTPFTKLGATAQIQDKPRTFGDFFIKELAVNDSGDDVLLLQEELRRLNFLGLQPTGYYGKITEHAVYKFQQNFGIVKDKNTTGAGSVGPQTLAKLNEIMNARGDQQKMIGSATQQREIIIDRISAESTLVAGTVVQETFAADISSGSRGAEIERLQKVLRRLGFFKGRLITQYFGDVTKVALQNFQKGHSLDETGEFDTRTRSMINKILAGA